MELIKLLTDQLGVSQDQAKGGAGLLFRLAKDKLSSDEYSQITDQVPGVDELSRSAPESGVLGSTLGGLVSGLSGGKTDIGDLAGLVGGFAKLGMDADTLGKFVPIILSFVKGKGGDAAKGLLSKVLA